MSDDMKDMQTRMRRIMAWGEKRDMQHHTLGPMEYAEACRVDEARDKARVEAIIGSGGFGPISFPSPRSPESTTATLGDLQAMELRILRDHKVILDRIARLERQVAAIPGFLESLK